MFLSTFFPHRRLNKKKLGNVCCCRSIKICLYLFLIFYSPQKLYYWGCIATKKNPSGQTKFSFCPTTSIHGWYLWTKNVFFRLFGQETVSGDTILYIYIYIGIVFFTTSTCPTCIRSMWLTPELPDVSYQLIFPIKNLYIAKLFDSD